MLKTNELTKINRKVRFSVIIPMFNASHTIVKTLDSCLEQTLLPKEIIIVDDCSSDDSIEKVEQWREAYGGDVKVMIASLSENSGPSKARNRGWDLANGEYIAFLDADDRFLPKKLEKVGDVFVQNSNIVLLGHGYSVDDESITESAALKKVSVKALLFKNLTTTPSVIVKREIKERFDESMRYTEDHDLWLRITQRYDETYFLETVLTIIGRPVRAKGGQSDNLWAMRKGEIKMYRKYCQDNSRIFLFPFFLLYSLAKHSVKMIKGIS